MLGTPLVRTALLAAALCVGCAFSPDPERRNAALDGLSPQLAPDAVEVVVELEWPPGNLGVGADGRVFFTFHPDARPSPTKFAELRVDGTVAPFPDAAWQSERDDGPYFVTPLAVRVDARGRVWVLDHGDYGAEQPSLTAFDPTTSAVVHRLVLDDDWGSMLNDFAVDAARDVVYIADTSAYDFDPSILVYDVKSGAVRWVLEDHDSVRGEDDHLVVQGRFITVFGVAVQVAVDTIALSPDGEWLYYGPLTGRTLWRVPTGALRDPTLDDDALATQVERHGAKPTTDGATTAADGSVYLTAIEYDAIAVSHPDGTLTMLAENAELLAWPDGVALSPDGQWLYVASSELHHVIGADLDELPKHAPFRILRVPVGGSR